jgi:hypothetical protein
MLAMAIISNIVNITANIKPNITVTPSNPANANG